MKKGIRLLDDISRLISALAKDGRIGLSIEKMYLQRIKELRQELIEEETDVSNQR